MPSPSCGIRPGRRTLHEAVAAGAVGRLPSAASTLIGAAALARSEFYRPPLGIGIGSDVRALATEIAEPVGPLSLIQERDAVLRLPRINRIRTIQGTLAIEGGGLTTAQVTAILEGRGVSAPPQEIQEARTSMPESLP
jgi:hypothetical protein